MKIIINEKTIKNRRLIGQILTITSLVILGIGLYLSFKPENPQNISISFLALIVGFMMSQAGIYFGNRWGKSPRPDEVINKALKGLDGKYSVYHYKGPVPHLLIGPAGIWILIPYHQGGTITFDEQKKRWQQKGGNFYLKIFAQESLGRPDIEIETYLRDYAKFINKNMPETQLPDPQVALIFLSDRATVEADNAPIPTMSAEKLKDFTRKVAKQSNVPMDQIEELAKHLPQE